MFFHINSPEPLSHCAGQLGEKTGGSSYTIKIKSRNNHLYNELNLKLKLILCGTKRQG